VRVQLARRGADPWREYWTSRQAITAKMRAALAVT
jgi:hypothetical protein